MKILIPYDVTTTGMKNPYLFLLMRELHQFEEITELLDGYGWLHEPGTYDIIHLHWPELLVKSQLPDMSRTNLLRESHFDRVLESIKKKQEGGAKVIITIHNEKPHKDKSGLFADFYREVYSLSNGFIHMGEASKNRLGKDYTAEIQHKPEFVIPHGDYSFFPENLNRPECRNRLNIMDNERMLLSFGAVRSKDELELGIDAFQKAGLENGVYFIAGSIPNPYRSQPEHFIVRKKLYANIFNNRIRTHEKTIAPDDVQIYLKSADLLMISRFNTLNSGNIALGFTFGKVVIGPDYGVIGEILKETGNPVFDPSNIDSVSDAIIQGFELADKGHGMANKQYANKNMRWSQIAQDTFEAYQSLL